MRSGSKAPIPSHVTSRLLLTSFQSRKIITVNSANRGELLLVGGSILERERELTDSCLHSNHPSNHTDYDSKIKVLVAIINRMNHKLSVCY